MASRYEVEVTIASARDLKNVNWRHGKLSPYAVVWVDPKAKCSTPVDDAGDSSPVWDHRLLIPLTDHVEESTLYIDIVHAGDDGEDTKPLVGSARLPLRDLVDDVGFGRRSDLPLQLKRPSGRPQGKIEVSVTVREAGYRASEPYYPPPASRDYPAQPYASPYGGEPPQHAGYGAPPSGYSAYGAPASYGQNSYYGEEEKEKEKEKEKKSSFGGMGMGTGLAVGAVAGVLGGVALMEGYDALEDHIADDVEERLEEEDKEEEEEEEEEENEEEDE